MTALIYLDVYPADSDTCIEYGLSVASFSPGRPSRSGHPLDPSGEDGEIELADFCTVEVDGREVGVTTLEVALLAYAADRRISLDHAWRKAEDMAFEAACEREADRDEDARQAWAEDRADEGRWA